MEGEEEAGERRDVTSAASYKNMLGFIFVFLLSSRKLNLKGTFFFRTFWNRRLKKEKKKEANKQTENISIVQSSLLRREPAEEIVMVKITTGPPGEETCLQ